ncbi:MAG TPA: Gfo/Idh/MocA family oxidoreductase [Chloroflexota bacterium]|nr:Gfo/Idh/MocA family oxidoreductase [Chloroflexota bacterium]
MTTAGESPVGVAVVGAGSMGGQHVRAYQGAGAEVVAICDVDAARAEALAGSIGARAYTDVDSMLDEAHPAAVSICTPPAQHVAPALAAAECGVGLLIEKPLANALAPAREIADAVHRHGVVCMIGFCHRFHEPVLQIKERLEAGEIGRPVLFRNRFAYEFEGVENTWFSDPAVAGGGTLMDTSVHSLDLYRFLIGDIDRVAAELDTVTPGLSVEDNSVLLVNGPTRVPGIIEASWTTPAGDSELIIFGTEGNLGVDYGQGDFGVAFIETPQAGRRMLDRSGVNRFVTEIRHFLDAVRGGQDTRPNVDDGLRTLEAIDAAYLSVGQSRPSPSGSGINTNS